MGPSPILFVIQPIKIDTELNNNELRNVTCKQCFNEECNIEVSTPAPSGLSRCPRVRGLLALEVCGLWTTADVGLERTATRNSC